MKSYYWDGTNDPNVHTCACGATDSCITSLVSCNCDSSAPQWISDEGNLTDMSGAEGISSQIVQLFIEIKQVKTTF